MRHAVSPRESLTVTVLAAVAGLMLLIAIVGCAAPAHAQERLALVVPEKEAAELARLQKQVDEATAALEKARERARKNLTPKEWPCCLVRWSRDYRVMWPEMPTPKWDLTYRDTPLYRPDLITPLYYGTLAK